MIIIIPGWLISLVTFPGVIIHELAHKLFCDLTRTRVYRVAYFVPFETTAGYVMHEGTHSVASSFLISMAPLFINSLVCMILTIPYGVEWLRPIPLCGLPTVTSAARFLIMWVGFSAGLHAMPSNKDLDSIKESEHFLSDLLISLVTVVVRICNIEIIGSFLKLGYAVLLSLIIPYILLH